MISAFVSPILLSDYLQVEVGEREASEQNVVLEYQRGRTRHQIGERHY